MYRNFRVNFVNLVTKTSSENNNFLCNSHRYQTVRWMRKPWWLPVAKSKQFRVAERKKIPRAEYDTLKTLFNNYRTEMKSLRHYFQEKVRQSTTAPEVIADLILKEEEEHRKCVALNDEWNKNVGKSREARILADREKLMEEALKIVEQHQIAENERKLRIEATVKEEKEKSKHYITEENIDVAIENALSEIKDYNFCIDLQGNIYHGRTARPPEKSPPKEINENIQAAVSG